ncbi:MAG: hypothetical protein QOK30_366 [Nocardioidaceae bacterium]|nr:hypothetical protein [Frankiaceae bacterium]MDX6365290.1 hypothetical protein [Nocardioidaceae bacterium]
MGRGLAGTNEAMTSEPLPNADPADIAEQTQDAYDATDGEVSADLGSGDLPLEANEADVVEQRLEAPAQLDDDVDEA